MIIRNNAANRRLVNQMRDIVEAETGFRAHIDRTWNRGDDIRFEIGVVGMDAPFITVTDLDADGHFQISLRMQLTDVPMDRIWELACRLESVTTMRNRIGALVAGARPEPSCYAR
mgnify:CR=1 FL=1